MWTLDLHFRPVLRYQARCWFEIVPLAGQLCLENSDWYPTPLMKKILRAVAAELHV